MHLGTHGLGLSSDDSCVEAQGKVVAVFQTKALKAPGFMTSREPPVPHLVLQLSAQTRVHMPKFSPWCKSVER